MSDPIPNFGFNFLPQGQDFSAGKTRPSMADDTPLTRAGDLTAGLVDLPSELVRRAHSGLWVEK